jgi:histidinol phosphatase-like PHP family hydrolase
MADVVRRQFRTGINAGVAVNCGLGFAITNDAGIDRALAELRTEPRVYVGMQAEGREWVGMFSREAMAKFDYVFTDAMTLSDDRGRRMRLWIPEEVEVGDPQVFMDMLVSRTVQILEREPVDVWVNPTFLPAVIAGDYANLWTEARMRRVIEAAVRNRVAIEINDRFRLPSAAFIRLAKQAGARFTFGTNNGGKDDLGSLSYGVRMVGECGLKWQDLWVPGEKAR